MLYTDGSRGNPKLDSGLMSLALVPAPGDTPALGPPLQSPLGAPATPPSGPEAEEE